MLTNHVRGRRPKACVSKLTSMFNLLTVAQKFTWPQTGAHRPPLYGFAAAELGQTDIAPF